MRALIALAGMLMLAGCATTDPSATAPIALPSLPASLSEPCARPAKLPGATLNAGDTERYWATDRTNLAKCADRHAAAVGNYETLRQKLAGARR